jgi:O-acetyl-ADP-ribose deacetylase
MGDRIDYIILIPIRRHAVMEDTIEIIQGDITTQEVDAVVNAANTTLLGGGGVDGAIHRAAGPELVAETRKIGGCPTGEARATKGYNLPAKWVIHTVGPVWGGGKRNEDALLASCYINCFKTARELGVKTIAFPSISTGAYMFPLERATEIALNETKKALKSDREFNKVIFVCFGEKVLKTYEEIYRKVFAD